MTDPGRAATVAVAAVVALTAVASGPLVGGVDLTTGSDVPALSPGTGNTTVTVDRVPESGYRLTPGRFGSETYYLEAPDLTVTVGAVSGQPILNYKVQIPALDYTNIQVHILSPDDEGELTLSMDRSAVEQDPSDRDSYPGVVRVVLRSGGTARTVLNRSVTVTVEQ